MSLPNGIAISHPTQPPYTPLITRDNEEKTAISMAGPKLIEVLLIRLAEKKDTMNRTPGATIAARAMIESPNDDIAGGD